MQHSSDNKIIARPGDSILVSSSETIEQKTRNLIALTDSVFEVARVYTFKSLQGNVAVETSHVDKKRKIGVQGNAEHLLEGGKFAHM